MQAKGRWRRHPHGLFAARRAGACPPPSRSRGGLLRPGVRDHDALDRADDPGGRARGDRPISRSSATTSRYRNRSARCWTTPDFRSRRVHRPRPRVDGDRHPPLCPTSSPAITASRSSSQDPTRPDLLQNDPDDPDQDRRGRGARSKTSMPAWCPSMATRCRWPPSPMSMNAGRVSNGEGLGQIDASGLRIREKYRAFDAEEKFGLGYATTRPSRGPNPPAAPAAR